MSVSHYGLHAHEPLEVEFHRDGTYEWVNISSGRCYAVIHCKHAEFVAAVMLAHNSISSHIEEIALSATLADITE